MSFALARLRAGGRSDELADLHATGPQPAWLPVLQLFPACPLAIGLFPHTQFRLSATRAAAHEIHDRTEGSQERPQDQHQAGTIGSSPSGVHWLPWA